MSEQPGKSRRGNLKTAGFKQALSFLGGTLPDPTPLRGRVPARRGPGRRHEDPTEGHLRNTDRRLARAEDFNDPGFHVDLAVRVTRVRQELVARCPGQLPVE